MGAYTQDCGSNINMFILGKVSYFGMCDNSNPIWSGKCQAIPAQPFFTTTTTTAAAKRTAIPIEAAPFLPQHAGADTLPLRLDASDVDDEVDSRGVGDETESADKYDEDGYVIITSLADMQLSEAEPTLSA